MESTENGLTYSLNLKEMWKLVSKEENNLFGVAGYQIPKIHFDYKKQKLDKEMEQLHQAVWKGKEHYPSPKCGKDENGKDILPKRPFFVDDLIKQNKSSFSKKKYDAFVEKLQTKGLTLEDIEDKHRKKSSDKNKQAENSFFFKIERKTFLDEIVSDGKKKNNLSPEMKDLIAKVKEKQDKYSPKEKFLENNTRIFNKNLSKEIQRISHLSDIEYLGESIPYYNNCEKKITEDDDSSERKNKGKGVEFFPNKDVVLTRSPQWTIHNENKIIKYKDENNIKKIEDTRKSWENRRIKFIDDVSVSYFKVNYGKKGGFKYHNEIPKDPTYFEGKKNNPERHPGPQQYWQSPSLGDNSKKRISKEDQDTKEDESPKKLFADRDKTDKFITKPMKKYVF